MRAAMGNENAYTFWNGGMMITPKSSMAKPPLLFYCIKPYGDYCDASAAYGARKMYNANMRHTGSLAILSKEYYTHGVDYRVSY